MLSDYSDRKLDESVPIGSQLFSILRAQIVRVELAPGVQLSETAIAADFRVSRQPVREVFIKLAEEGLLEIRPQRGSFVPKISITKVEDARFVREAVEADVVKLAAERFDKTQAAELSRCLDAQMHTDDVIKFIELDDRFHRMLAVGSGHAHAWRVVETQKAHLDRVRHLSVNQFPKSALIDQHAEIVQAVRASDPAKAEEVMRRHLQMVSADIPKIAEAYPDFFDSAPQGAKHILREDMINVWKT